MYNVRIKNPEAIENACKNFTRVVRELYDRNAFKFQKEFNNSKETDKPKDGNVCE